MAKRGSDANLFSISGASEALNRSRRTISRALAGVKPDAKRHGLSLWKMGTIVENVNRKTQAPILSTASQNGDLQRMFSQLDEADHEMRGIESLEGRRAYARETLLPLLREVDQAMRADGRANGEPEMLTDLRCDQHLRVFLLAGLGPDASNSCNWSASEAWNAYNAGDGEEDEAA
jgi:hypothetical protein